MKLRTRSSWPRKAERSSSVRPALEICIPNYGHAAMWLKGFAADEMSCALRSALQPIRGSRRMKLLRVSCPTTPSVLTSFMRA